MATVPAEIIAALRGSHMLGIFVRLDTDPPARMWLGINDIETGIESVDPTTNEVYIGGGRLREIPALEAVINGIAERAEFGLSGIDASSGAKFFDTLPEVRRKKFHVGITVLDDNYQPITPIIPLITGRATKVTEVSEAVSGPQNPTVTLMLSVGFGITTRARESRVLWNSAHHRKRYPTDAICDGMARLARGVEPVWP